MIIKRNGYSESTLTTFDLLGYDEIGLSKAFAYLLSKESIALYKFLQFIGISIKNTEKNFRETEVIVEKKRTEGRTDIEIKQNDKYHIIIESKIKSNKIVKQRTQYLHSFDNEPQKCICFITQINDYQKQIYKGINVRNIGWIEIANLFDGKEFQKNLLISEFSKFIIRGYKMRDQKEILVQDLSDENEMRKYREYYIYRRNVIYGSPLYFSPYFTRKANQPEGEGISFISKILGILSFRPKELDIYMDDLASFANGDTEIVEKWLNGIKMESNSDEIFTYFFLDNPVRLKQPLLKDGTRSKGRGKNWIAAMIPQNRCDTFDEFIKRIVES